MALTLNHFSIRTTDLESSRAFYADVLALTVGPRPAFPFPGLWMYRGPHDDVANAVVHIIGIDRNDPAGLKAYLGDRDEVSLAGSGAVDHIAFFADGLAAMHAHLKDRAVPFRERTVPSIGLHQLFLEDPSGVVIELNYPASEQAGG
ncbi:MAG: VOC family protein [Burkholderiaceae bacterium]|nr:VOC family protein [Burkholderiaceae bacterium]